MGDGHRPVLHLISQHTDRGTLAHGLTNPLCKQRMVFAQVRADHQHALQVRQGSNRQAEVAHAFGRDKLSVTQAMVNVVTAQPAHQRPGQHQFFKRAVWAQQGPQAARAMLGFDLRQPVSHILKSRLPVHCLPYAPLLDHGAGQALIAVQRLIRKTVTVRYPAFVDSLVLQRHHAHHPVVFHLHHQIGSGGIMRADRLTARQLPGAGAVTEGLAGQGTDRANVNHVAREL